MMPQCVGEGQIVRQSEIGLKRVEREAVTEVFSMLDRFDGEFDSRQQHVERY